MALRLRSPLCEQPKTQHIDLNGRASQSDRRIFGPVVGPMPGKTVGYLAHTDVYRAPKKLSATVPVPKSLLGPKNGARSSVWNARTPPPVAAPVAP